jgi:hypothetical protein
VQSAHFLIFIKTLLPLPELAQRIHFSLSLVP